MMKRVLPGIVIILSCICLFVLSSCGTYRVENEEQSIKTYICPNDNMFGLEKVVVFEKSVVAVFDKEICDRSDYGSMSYDEERVKYPAYANYMNVSTSMITESTIDIKNGKYVVSMSFEYDEADKFNPDEDVEITGFNVLGKRVTFYDGDIELFYSIEGGGSFDDFRQVYSQSSGKWGDIENELVSWPLIKPDDIAVGERN